MIERLSDLQRIAEILVSKFESSVNAWVVEASTFNVPFAVSKDFIPSVNIWGEPKSYNPTGFPASTSTVNLLLNCLKESLSACVFVPLFAKFCFLNSYSINFIKLTRLVLSVYFE